MEQLAAAPRAMPLDGTDGNLCIALADVSRYVIASRNVVSLTIDLETLADSDQVILNVMSRVGGVGSTPDAIRVGQT